MTTALPPSPTEVVHSVLVVGTGNFGTCLAYHLAKEMNYPVTMYARDKTVVDSINNDHVNTKYMKGVTLPNNLKATNNLNDEKLFEENTVIVLCIPTQFLRSVIEPVKHLFKPHHLVILANKGIEVSTLDLPVHIVKELFGKEMSDNCVFLSGPSFAVEVVAGQPTCVAVSSFNEERAIQAQKVFHSPLFRVYLAQNDPIGVEVAGALKNVVAIASGICSGLGFQMNTRSALLTRGLAEIMQVGTAMGGNPLTFLGLAGVGDLFLSCTSEKSRNFTVGYRLGKGEKLEYIIQTLGSVAEGVPTTKAAFQLSKKLGTKTPIIDEMYNILYDNKEINLAVHDLLNQVAKAELHFGEDTDFMPKQ